MTRPNDIPQDVWNYTGTLISGGWPNASLVHIAVARAIIDATTHERERCAKIAQFHHDDPTNDRGTRCDGCGDAIAAAIRKGSD